MGACANIVWTPLRIYWAVLCKYWRAGYIYCGAGNISKSGAISDALGGPNPQLPNDARPKFSSTWQFHKSTFAGAFTVVKLLQQPQKEPRLKWSVSFNPVLIGVPQRHCLSPGLLDIRMWQLRRFHNSDKRLQNSNKNSTTHSPQYQAWNDVQEMGLRRDVSSSGSKIIFLQFISTPAANFQGQLWGSWLSDCECIHPNADGQIQHIFCRTSWQFWNTLKPRMTQLVDQFSGSVVVLHLGLRLYVLTELTQMQREGVFFITFHIHGFLSARWQRGGQCFFKILSYLWIFYQPGAKGGRCLGNKCPSFRYLGQRLLLLILLLLGLHNAVHHQCTRCIAEGAYIAV